MKSDARNSEAAQTWQGEKLGKLIQPHMITKNTNHHVALAASERAEKLQRCILLSTQTPAADLVVLITQKDSLADGLELTCSSLHISHELSTVSIF